MDRTERRVKAGFIPAVTSRSIARFLQAWRLTGGGPAGEDLRPHPRFHMTVQGS
jgi:hypothetical protein